MRYLRPSVQPIGVEADAGRKFLLTAKLLLLVQAQALREKKRRNAPLALTIPLRCHCLVVHA